MAFGRLAVRFSQYQLFRRKVCGRPDSLMAASVSLWTEAKPIGLVSAFGIEV